MTIQEQCHATRGKYSIEGSVLLMMVTIDTGCNIWGMGKQVPVSIIFSLEVMKSSKNENITVQTCQNNTKNMPIGNIPHCLNMT